MSACVHEAGTVLGGGTGAAEGLLAEGSLITETEVGIGGGGGEWPCVREYARAPLALLW